MSKRFFPPVHRKRILFAVEGEGEQSLVKWLQQLADAQGMFLHLDCHVLRGGGYKTMFEDAKHFFKRKDKRKTEKSVLLIDEDRANLGDDGWHLSKLQQEAEPTNIIVCIQRPNLESIFLRMFPKKENLQPHPSNVERQLKKMWPEYKKPMDAFQLGKKFELDDLLRAAKADPELSKLLSMIGLNNPKFGS